MTIRNTIISGYSLSPFLPRGRHGLLAALIFWVSCVAPAAEALPSAANSGILGVWVSEKGQSRIEFFDCGDALCGRFVWLAKKDSRDENNPDPELRSRPLEGLTIFKDFTLEDDSDGEWTGGTVYDADDGATRGNGGVELSLRLLASGVLEVKGCWSFFCSNRTMTRFDPTRKPELPPPPPPPRRFPPTDVPG